ncbi:MAG: M28 family peptidase [Chlorobi bacterium]|nr:M28 family peptidase [Chlorobiota bacterium]
MRFYIALLIIGSAFLFSCGGGNKSSKSHSAKKKNIIKVPVFNGDSAYYFVEKQVSFGPRAVGSKAHKECGDWLIKKLEEYSDTVIVQPFKARTYDKVTRSAKNIISSFNPKNPNRILLMSHWDSRPFADHDTDTSMHNTPIDGANDGASGVGILLEMARLMKEQKPEIGIDIVLLDLEDWGPPKDLQMSDEEAWGLGAQYWSKNPHALGYTARYGILLDMVGTKNPVFPREYFSQEFASFALDIVWDNASDLGYGDVFVNRQGGATTDDHYFVNTIANIPTIDIIHLDRNSINGSFFDYWHTTGDNMQNIDKSTLEMVGKVLMRTVYHE